MYSIPKPRRAIRTLHGRGIRSDCDVSSGSCAVVFQTRETTLKAQRQTLADFHLSAQRGRGNDEKAVGRGRHRDVYVIFRNRASSNGSGLRRRAAAARLAFPESPSSRRACRPPPSSRPDRGWVPRALGFGLYDSMSSFSSGAESGAALLIAIIEIQC